MPWTGGNFRVARHPPRTKKSGRLVSTLFGECLGDLPLEKAQRVRGGNQLSEEPVLRQLAEDTDRSESVNKF
jgi:hypothetical protein